MCQMRAGIIILARVGLLSLVHQFGSSVWLIGLALISPQRAGAPVEEENSGGTEADTISGSLSGEKSGIHHHHRRHGCSLSGPKAQALACPGALGLGCSGNFSGDDYGDILIAFSTLFIAFSTLIAFFPRQPGAGKPTAFHPASVFMPAKRRTRPGFLAIVPATEEAIVNARVAVVVMTGIHKTGIHDCIQDKKVIALPQERSREVLREYNRLAK